MWSFFFHICKRKLLFVLLSVHPSAFDAYAKSAQKNVVARKCFIKNSKKQKQNVYDFQLCRNVAETMCGGTAMKNNSILWGRLMFCWDKFRRLNESEMMISHCSVTRLSLKK